MIFSKSRYPLRGIMLWTRPKAKSESPICATPEQGAPSSIERSPSDRDAEQSHLG
jgi:hypothetical protein